VTFANPAGAWALLALLAVLAIHLLQRRRRRVLVSTLFLLAPQPSTSLGGRRLERLRRSASLWLQLAAAAVCAFVLMLPQRVLEDSRQKVVVVLDASISMSAFRHELRAALTRRVAEIAAGARHTDWALLESVSGRRPVYAGADGAALLAALETWQPREPHHDPASALDNARALAGPDGLAVFVTDHEAVLPEGFERLSVGRPVDNVGIVGLDVDAALADAPIRVVVRNHGRNAARRGFWAEVDGKPTASSTLELAPGEVKVLTSTFPKGRDSVVLALEPDTFTLDDRAPVVRPRPKRVRARLTSANPTVAAWLSSLRAVDVAEPADIVLGPVTPAADAAATVPSVRWLAAGEARLTRGSIVAEKHPLVDGLAWHGVVTPSAAGFEAKPDDTVLVWAGARPLVFLRGPRQLRLNFPLTGSNAERVPALLVLLHRFVEDVRREKVAPEHGNVECRQELTVATGAADPPLRLSWDKGEGDAGSESELRAPWRPAFFDVHAGQERRLTGAAHFADVREADFSRAASSQVRAETTREVRRRHTRDDPWLPLWIAVLGALLVTDWSLAARGHA
jgi:hypothetical protein